MAGHSLRTHRKYSASSAPRFFRCKASVKFTEGMPDVRTEYAQDGTEAHELLEYALVKRIRSARDAYKDCPDTIAWKLDDHALHERLDAIQVALDHVFGILDLYSDAVLWTERELPVFTMNATGEAGGTCDITIYIPSLKRLYIFDYKHGAGVAVEVLDPVTGELNEQAMMYGLGAWEDASTVYGVIDANAVLHDAVDHIVIGVIQPRIWHPAGLVREYDLTPATLQAFYHRLEETIAEAESGTAPFVPGEKQCQFCNGKAVCPTREARAVEATKGLVSSFRSVPELPEPSHLDISRLAEIFANRHTLYDFLKGVEDHVKSLLNDGVTVPGAKLVEVQGRRQYEGDDKDIAQKLVTYTGLTLDEVFPRKLIGITDAERAVIRAYRSAAGKDKAAADKAAQEGKKVMAYLTTKATSGNLTLVDESDPRPAVNRAQRTFANVQVLEVK